MWSYHPVHRKSGCLAAWSSQGALRHYDMHHCRSPSSEALQNLLVLNLFLGGGLGFGHSFHRWLFTVRPLKQRLVARQHGLSNVSSEMQTLGWGPKNLFQCAFGGILYCILCGSQEPWIPTWNQKSSILVKMSVYPSRFIKGKVLSLVKDL